MQFDEVEFPSAPPVDGYGPGFFRIGGRIVSGPVAVLPGGASEWRDPDDSSAFLAAQDAVDLVLIGTGAEFASASEAFARPLESAGISVESMATPTACRTYNVLLSEGRRVAAALMPV